MQQRIREYREGVLLFIEYCDKSNHSVTYNQVILMPLYVYTVIKKIGKVRRFRVCPRTDSSTVIACTIVFCPPGAVIPVVVLTI